MSRTVWGALRVCAILTVLAMLASGLAGCKDSSSASSGDSDNGGSDTTAGKPVFEEDTAAVQTAIVGSAEGTTFETASGEGTATVMVMPGTFPDGTTLTFTPLVDTGDGALAPGFSITSDSDAEMALPAFVVFETPGEISETSDIMLYDEDSDEPVPLYVTEVEDAGGTLLIAEVTHFTVFRFEDFGDKRPTKENKNNPYQRGFKEWAIKVNDSTPIDDGLWKGAITFEMDVRSPAGDIFGPYNGQATYAINADVVNSILTGHASGTWAGAIAFSPAVVRKWQHSYDPTTQTEDIIPGFGFWLSAEGTHYANEVTPFNAEVSGPGVSGSFAIPGYGTEVPVELFISESGATVTAGDQVFHGLVIGTLE